jgi:hypothetical protein
VPIAVVTVLAWPVMVYLWASSVRKVVHISIAVLDRYGLPRKLRWNVPLKRPEDFDRWLVRRMAQP